MLTPTNAHDVRARDLTELDMLRDLARVSYSTVPLGGLSDKSTEIDASLAERLKDPALQRPCTCDHSEALHVEGMCEGMSLPYAWCKCPAFVPASCKACEEKRLHTEKDWLNHPTSRHGRTKEWGWSSPLAKAEHDAEAASKEAK